jgi:antitoxin (DNA-binding transcriptional repressor) of toxin-antitoxin stability system
MTFKVQHEHEFRVVPAGLFKATCLQLMDEVYENRNLSILITKRGKPVGQLTAPPQGLTLTGPTVHIHAPAAVDSAERQTESPAATEGHRKKKKDKKKKHK